jgi:hypothetical protein
MGHGLVECDRRLRTNGGTENKGGKGQKTAGGHVAFLDENSHSVPNNKRLS